MQLPRRYCPVSTTPCYDHYRLLLTKAEEPQALFLPGFTGAVAVRYNNVLLAEIGRLSQPLERLSFQPAFVRLPTSPSTALEAELVITIGADARRFFRLEPFYIGAVDDLQNSWRLTRWLSIDLLRASIGIYLALGSLALLLYHQADRNPLFAWFIWVVALAAVRNLYFLWTNPDFSLFRELMYVTSSLVLLVSSAGFAGAMVSDALNPWHRRAMLLTIPVSAFLAWRIFIDPYAGGYLANTFIRGFGVVVGAWVMFLLGRYLKATWHPVKPWVLALFVGAFVLVLHDTSPVVTNTTVLVQLTNLAPLLLVMAFCLILAAQFGNALHSVRIHNTQLRSAIEKREQELAQAYDTTRAAERTQAVLVERERILRDVHDGVGGRLAGLILMARRLQQPAMAEQLQASLADLRLIIDSLDSSETETHAGLLDMFRTHIKPWLRLHNIDLHVHQNGELNTQSVFSATQRLQLLRLLQEGVNNVVKHAQATQITLTATTDSNQILLQLEDDGCGFDATRQQQGRGLKNMHARAHALYAKLVINSAPGRGTQLQVHWPYPQGSHPQDPGGSYEQRIV